ncbi:MAG TPA: hypothetical protein VLK25_06055 [Allosphingosinicella sp.]|nr:hypothetical protein [Allosphingosinicella sp.]
MIQGFMTQFLIQLAFVAVLILVVIMVVIRMGRLGGNAASAVKTMADPVPGTLLVTAISMPGRGAMYQMARLTGVVSAEGIEPFAVQHSGIVRSAQWPQPGTTLPVILDRNDPQNFAIEWDKIKSGADAALDNAEALAAAMRAKQDGDSA